MLSVLVIRLRSLRLLRVSGIVMRCRMFLLLITFLKASQSVRNRLLVICKFFQAEDGIRDLTVTGVQTCGLPISHAEFLRRVTLDKELVEALEKDYTTAPITTQDRAMLDYAVKLTRDATKIWKDDMERLREAGFDDRGILQITLIAAWFNYINRVADALGVGRE